MSKKTLYLVTATVAVLVLIPVGLLVLRLVAPRPPLDPQFREFDLNFVIQPGFKGNLRVFEDSNLKPSKDGTYTLRQKGNMIGVPKGLVLEKGHSFYRIRKVYDTTGRLISEGLEPPPGVLTVRTLFYLSEPDSKNSSKSDSSYYFAIRDR